MSHSADLTAECIGILTSAENQLRSAQFTKPLSPNLIQSQLFYWTQKNLEDFSGPKIQGLVTYGIPSVMWDTYERTSLLDNPIIQVIESSLL